MSDSTEDQPVSVEESTAAATSKKRPKMAKAAKRAKAVKKKKKTGVPEIKFFITAAALTATVGGWAGMATSLATTASPVVPIAEQVAPSEQVTPSGQALRSVTIPNASAPSEQTLRQATRPEPAARTRGSN